MFVLNGRILPLDVPFEANGTLFPANWLRLATPEERAAQGITEQPDPPWYDARFYWGYSNDGTLIPKDLPTLISEWSDLTRGQANSLLTPTDWLVIREADNGVPVPAEWRTWRENIRLAAGTKINQIEQSTTVEELAAYVTSSSYTDWPSQPIQNVENPEVPAE